MICLMARKNYSEDFRRQAVQLYESTPGATFQGIAADLGISRGALAGWVRALGSDPEVKDASPAVKDGASGSGNAAAGAAPPSPPPGGGAGRVPPSARIARLEAQVAALEAEKKKLATERDILRQAAKYFAGETNW
jgi:transposase